MKRKSPAPGVWFRDGEAFVERRDPLASRGGKVPVGSIPAGARPASGTRPNSRVDVPAPASAASDDDAADASVRPVEEADGNVLAETVGPFYDHQSVCRWLGITDRQAAHRVETRSLLALTTGNGALVYPAWQFTGSGDQVPYLGQVVEALSKGIDDPWTWALWLTAPDDDLGGQSSVAHLARGGDPAPVLTMARADATRWAT